MTLGLAAIHCSGKDHFPIFNLYFYVGCINVVVIAQLIIYIFADAVIRALVAFRPLALVRTIDGS